MDEARVHPRSPGTPGGLDRQTSARRVRDLVRAGIRSGLYDLDEQLVEDTLIATLGASRNAVRQALRALADEGLVQRRRHDGTTVRQRSVTLSWEDFMPTAAVPGALRARLVEMTTVPATALVRARLQCDDEEVRLAENVFEYAGRTIGVRTAYYRLSHERLTIPLSDASTLGSQAEMVRATHGVELGSPRSVIEASTADEKTARMLDIPLHASVLLREQVNVDVDGTPVSLVFDHYRGDCVAFTNVPADRAAHTA